MNYIIISPSAEQTSKQRAEAITKAYWDIQRPQSVRDPRDVTDRIAHVVVHPTTNEAAIMLPDGLNIRPHTDYDTTNLFEVVTEYTSQEQTDVASVFINNVGTNITLTSVLPAAFTLTPSATMQSNGWFPAEE